VHLLMGPWTHGAATPEEPFAGDVEFGDEAALEFLTWHEGVFDQYLKGKPMPERPALRLFVMGGGSGEKSASGRLVHGGYWRNESEWPLARTQFTDFYLTASGSLSLSPPEEADAFSEYRYDPDDPVPSIGGNVSSLSQLPRELKSRDLDDPAAHELVQILTAGGFDQVEAPGVLGCEPPYLPLAGRQDVLVFETGALVEAMEVTGPVRVRLWVSTSAVDTDFTAKLIDVYPPNSSYPDGYRLNLTDSIQRLSFRSNNGKRELVQPDEVIEVEFELYPTSNLFAAGHRIRLDISSSNFPRFDPHSNTADPRVKIVARNRVYHDSKRPSHLTLPLIPV
ncbi:MAG: CocE/NonD family hydrolase, partial [Pseudomonadales bacterium]|nr:CocE/NonD family hydrolase [Pseudomonadales bacterium]